MDEEYEEYEEDEEDEDAEDADAATTSASAALRRDGASLGRPPRGAVKGICCPQLTLWWTSRALTPPAPPLLPRSRALFPAGVKDTDDSAAGAPPLPLLPLPVLLLSSPSAAAVIAVNWSADGARIDSLATYGCALWMAKVMPMPRPLLTR